MNLDEMLRILEEEGQKQCEIVTKDGEAQAAKILEEAEEEARKIKEQELEKVLASLQTERAKILNEARLFVKRQIIQAKEEFIQKAFSEAKKKLNEIRKSKDYKTIFKNLLNEAMEGIEGKIMVDVDKEDEKVAREVLSDSGLGYELYTSLTSLGGLKVSTPDGRITLTNTIDTRLEKGRQLLKTEIMTTLFG
jgi:V/A-type H+-transporting ATPase subunit E